MLAAFYTCTSSSYPAIFHDLQGRVSSDYHHTNADIDWRIGVTSIFAEALGIAPYKDGFWTPTNNLDISSVSAF